VAFAANGDSAKAGKEHEQLKNMQDSAAVKAMDNPYFPGTKILAVAEHVLAGKIAAARGETNAAIEHLRKAVSAEDELPYMEPPYWYYSAKLSLGAALLKAGQAAEAEKVFREDLKDFPNCGWQLFGLRESLRAQGKEQEARDVAKQFKEAWRRADCELKLEWL
jgi:tetratricopeptide (TPR) repeat protein